MAGELQMCLQRTTVQQDGDGKMMRNKFIKVHLSNVCVHYESLEDKTNYIKLMILGLIG